MMAESVPQSRKVAAGLEELRLRLSRGAPRADTISERRSRKAGQSQAKCVLVALFSENLGFPAHILAHATQF